MFNPIEQHSSGSSSTLLWYCLQENGEIDSIIGVAAVSTHTHVWYNFVQFTLSIALPLHRYLFSSSLYCGGTYVSVCNLYLHFYAHNFPCYLLPAKLETCPTHDLVQGPWPLSVLCWVLARARNEPLRSFTIIEKAPSSAFSFHINLMY